MFNHKINNDKNVPLLQAISIAMAVRRCKTKLIAWCSMSMAIPEATRHRHWETTYSILPKQPLGQQQMKLWCKSTPTLLAILMAMAMRWFNTTCIAWWRRSRASLEATGCCHQAIIVANSSNQTCICQFWLMFFIISTLKTGAKQKDGPN